MKIVAGDFFVVGVVVEVVAGIFGSGPHGNRCWVLLLGSKWKLLLVIFAGVVVGIVAGDVCCGVGVFAGVAVVRGVGSWVGGLFC